MATTHFNSMPNVSLPRTKMGVSFTHATSLMHGDIVPIFHIWILPGDTFKLDLSGLMRMSTPAAPIFGNIEVKVHSFFVPLRLIWDHTEEFFGENKSSSGPQTQEYLLPTTYYGTNTYNTAAKGGLSHYLGKPLKHPTLGYIDDHQSVDAAPQASVLPERGYFLIWNEFYRRQQVQNPEIIYTGDQGKVLVSDNIGQCFDKSCKKTTKKDDYFTSATIAPQYSADPVYLPLGDWAPLAFLGESDGSIIDQVYTPKIWLDDKEKFIVNDGSEVQPYISFGRAQSDGVTKLMGSYGPNAYMSEDVPTDMPSTFTADQFKTNLGVNLRETVAANVNDVRLAFAMQRYLERDNFGTRYPELIKSHYGVESSLAILQRPQLLYKGSQYINIQQVLATVNNSDTNVGQPGANSVTAFKMPIVHNSFDEHGILYILLETKYNRSYTQGLNKFDMKRSKWEVYTPELATIGDQAIKMGEIYAQEPGGEFSSFDDVFGYQEAWAEYRYFPDRVSGELDPQAGNSTFNFWTLADDLGSDEVNGVNGDFLTEDRTSLARALVTGNNGPDYIGDFAVTGSMIRVMPLYSIPGLVDHVGGR